MNAISTIKKKLGVSVGYSDHTLGYEVSLAACAIGACLIEKHFTLNKKLKGWDHHMSINEKQMSQMTFFAKNIHLALGSDKIKRIENKSMIEAFRRSIVAGRNIKKGEKIYEKDLDYKRPGIGLEPDQKKKILGLRAKKNIMYDEILNRKDFV